MSPDGPIVDAHHHIWEVSRVWKPVIEEAVAIFGSERCLPGSNGPIEMIRTSDDQILDMPLDCLAPLSSAKRRMVLHNVAHATYRI